jgi:flavin reductase (DIM6/NTAB) family NADH-FMN oxidoreductase RutF
MSFSELATSEVSGLYGLLTRSVVPRPIAFVSTVSASGSRNLAPFSYFMLGGGAPASLAFSTVVRSGGAVKDTLANIQEIGEFTVNLVTREIAAAMNLTAPEFDRDVDEWDVSGLASVESRFVKPAYVELSPVGFACRLFQVVAHGEATGAARYVIGEVVGVRVREDVLKGSSVLAVGRLGGAEYVDLDGPSVFEMNRP